MAVYWGAGAAFLIYLAMTFAGGKLLNLSGSEFYIFFGLLSALGLTGCGLWIWFKTKYKGAPEIVAGSDASIDQIVQEADARLAAAPGSQGAKIANVPLLFVVGDQGSTKTSTLVYSGIEPELLAGNVYNQANQVVPTQHANIWFARGTAFVEAAGTAFADPAKWLALVRRLKPATLKSLVGKGQQAPRGVLLCFDIETFAKPGSADAIATAARYIQTRFAEISQVLGINFPVYVLFTRIDRIQFFADYVRNLSNEEATQVFGATLPIRTNTGGVYAQDETTRLTAAYNDLFTSLCDKRTVFLPREGDSSKTPQPYEFPREFNKLRASVVNFLVEICRPSQLQASPFLRGFYFSGVRPITVSDSAPLTMKPNAENSLQQAGAATQMFRAGKLQEEMQKQAQASPTGAGRRVPQWMFLGHLFNDILLKDTSALAASGSSTKTSGIQRWLLGLASLAFLFLSIGFIVSYFGNQSLEDDAISAAKALPAASAGELQGCALPSLDQLQKLDTLRKSVEQLTAYADNGAPTKLRLGLYAGDELLPQVRRAYYDRFKALLFGQTQKGLVGYMKSVPEEPSPSDDYGYAYDSVKTYLLTTREWKRTDDKGLGQFLGSTLNQRWSTCKQQDIPKETADLAKTQFAFYGSDLKHGNPYSTDADVAVPKAQRFLSKFGGIQAAYRALLAKADREKPATTYNERFKGSDFAVVSRTPVRYAFTKPGNDFMMKLLKGADFGGEPWVLGEFSASKIPKDDLVKGISDLYAADYKDTWRKVLREAAFTGYPGGLPDAETKLQRITGSTQPILCLLWWASQSTNVDLGNVKQAFAPVQFVQPPSDTEVCIVDKNRPYNDALMRLQAAIAQANQPAVDAVSKATMISNEQNAAKNATRSVSSGPVDSEAQLDTVVTNLMLQPITSIRPPDPGAGANGAGGAFCVSFNGLKSKFPFRKGTPEVSLQELSDIFKPQTGKLWQFYEQTAKPFVTCSSAGCAPAANPPMPVNPAFVSSFSDLVRFSKALYGDNGTEPNYKYSLRPRSDFHESFNLIVNGEKSSVKSGAQSKVYSWPGPGSPSFVIEAVRKGDAQQMQSDSTLWSVFRVFAQADKNTGTNFTFFIRSGPQQVKIDGRDAYYEFSVDTQGAPAIFSQSFLASLNCVGRVTATR